MTARKWLAQLEAAWRRGDPVAIGELFTADATYHQGPFNTPHRGPAEVSTHWTDTLARQADARIWFGEPVESGDRAGVEWWCVVLDPVTRVPRSAAGCLMLRFAPDGRCASLHEYWQTVQQTDCAPPPGWFGAA